MTLKLVDFFSLYFLSYTRIEIVKKKFFNFFNMYMYIIFTFKCTLLFLLVKQNHYFNKTLAIALQLEKGDCLIIQTLELDFLKSKTKKLRKKY